MDEEKTRAEVAHIEFISYGTSRIFDRRMRSLDWKRKVVTFLGVFVPLMIGCAVLSFGLEAPFLPLCITIAGVASIMQLGFSLWSLVSGWDRSYSDCMAASSLSVLARYPIERAKSLACRGLITTTSYPSD
nr:mobilome CxxCx(11)CxxC protein [Escherichia coli]